MLTSENVTLTAESKKCDVEAMVELFLKMSELNRAKVFGYAQGVESMPEKFPERQAG